MNDINKGKRDILIFPKFKNIDKIQEIRKEYDELAEILPAHITLAFPFESEISNLELKRKLEEILINVKPFKIKCNGITIEKDFKINTYYIFLNIIEGKDEIIKIHNEIYKNILLKKIKYAPHITLGNTNNINENINLKEDFETIIDSIAVESIGDNEESNIEFEIELNL